MGCHYRRSHGFGGIRINCKIYIKIEYGSISIWFRFVRTYTVWILYLDKYEERKEMAQRPLS